MDTFLGLLLTFLPSPFRVNLVYSTIEATNFFQGFHFERSRADLRSRAFPTFMTSPCACVDLIRGRWAPHPRDRSGTTVSVGLPCSPPCGRSRGRSRWMLRLCGSSGGWNRRSSSCTGTRRTCCPWMDWRSWGRRSRGCAARLGPAFIPTL